MSQKYQTSNLSRGSGIVLSLGLAFVLILFVISGIVAYFNTSTLRDTSLSVTRTHDALMSLSQLLSTVKDAETGQRGYVITGQESYLQPHSTAERRINEIVSELQRDTEEFPVLVERLSALRGNLEEKLSELRQTIQLRREKGFEGAREVVESDRGKAAMDAIRADVAELQSSIRQVRNERLSLADDAFRVAVVSGVLTGLLGVVLSSAVAWLIRRSIVARQRQAWLQAGHIGLAAAMTGDLRLDQIGDNILRFFAEYLQAQAGVFFVKDGAKYRRVAAYGVPALGGAPTEFDGNDGLLGQSAKDGRTFILDRIPDGYLTLGSSFGREKPRHLAVVPATQDRTVPAVFELGALRAFDAATQELFEAVSGMIAGAVKVAEYRSHLQSLLEETQRQAEELQTQAEELRVSNEELEEQSRALKESQSRLETQQAELEQTNSQLEEQTQVLESQRDDINRSKSALEMQARDLEQASRYKSDFLANMSHELRTPLNSSLILSKLLAENTAGNLTAEQVRYAENIQAAGNDLLTLINDILDLSKIEAGHMEINAEPCSIARMLADLERVFRPIAEQKQLTFSARMAPGCPESITTDRQRLEQVLKNLLSNAHKFTEHGQVELSVSQADRGKISFAVKDTGIGIAADQQNVVFDAFKQADGKSNRKYGGTGLGLSISRELTRLLGGEIRLESEPGKGSTFTVLVPELYEPAIPRKSHPSPTAATTSHSVPMRVIPDLPSLTATASGQFEDDRKRLTGKQRVMLIVEDDASFSRILYDLAHELDFQCLLAETAEEGIAVATQYLPDAIILDLGLPDHSGLSVLDRLKHDRRTRHIPVHVVSGVDYAETAMSLGAVGYMMKPVKREQLTDALKNLEHRLEQRMRRVLVVEDDPRQRESLRSLLRSHDVETVGAGNAAECLKQLESATFDCMVLDLSLPDASGYSLLEKLSREDDYAFPPVIVYTGRELSADEEQRLRKYSKSIIIKGAKSPERLLDEVTLFLHQVVSELPAEQQKMLEKARSRDAAIEGRRILIVEDDVRNVFALTSILEPRGAKTVIARNGLEALKALEAAAATPENRIDLVLMDVMMPEMDGLTAMREIRKRPEWKKLPVVMLTAKAMKDDQEQCVAAGANDYMAKPLHVEKLLSLVRVWMPR